MVSNYFNSNNFKIKTSYIIKKFCLSGFYQNNKFNKYRLKTRKHVKFSCIKYFQKCKSRFAGAYSGFLDGSTTGLAIGTNRYAGGWLVGSITQLLSGLSGCVYGGFVGFLYGSVFGVSKSEKMISDYRTLLRNKN